MEFANYNAQESWQIFVKFCRKNGISIGEGVQEPYTVLFDQLSRCREFANGRSVRTIFQETSLRMKARVIEAEETDNIDEIAAEDLLTLEEAIETLGL